jgi:hypothetical protein
VSRFRWVEIAIPFVLICAAAFEAAIALTWIPIGTEPGEGARYEAFVMTSALVALVAGFVISLALAARDRRSVPAAFFPVAAAALMVARYYTFDTYYLPTMTRYSEGEISATWVYGLSLAALAAAFAGFAKPRIGFPFAALVIFLCLLTASAVGIGK